MIAEVYPRVLALSFRLNGNVKAGRPIMFSIVPLPTDSNSCTLTAALATAPATIFLKEGSGEKGMQVFSFKLIFDRSDISVLILASSRFFMLLTCCVGEMVELLHGTVGRRRHGYRHCP